MRLVCPNCDAQYEVGQDAIPEAGRDVQCSNCGHAWFQGSLRVEAEKAAEEELFAAPEVFAPAVTAPAIAAVNPPVNPGVVQDEAAPAPSFAEPAPLQRRTLDESLMAVLREEAEREVKVRRTEDPQPIETQPDLGLVETASAISPAARRIAQMKGIDPEASPPSPPPSPRPATRREMLPDIEEINSTLRATSARRQDPDEIVDSLPDLTKPKRSAFRSGFVIMVSLAVLAALAYVMAPKVAAQIPGSAPAMQAYVEAVDQGRAQLDLLMKKAIGVLNGLGGKSE